MSNANYKLEALLNLLAKLDKVAVGFSGGVDSTFLAAAAYQVLKDKAVAVTACSATLPEREKQEAIELGKKIGIRHVLLPISELDSKDFIANTHNRCYFCKKLRFSAMAEWATQQEIDWVLEGSNADDLHDYRPGLKAVDELAKVISPLLEVGMNKTDIRMLSKQWGLSTADKPSAACLSSRVAYGQTITAERLGQIEAAEECIRQYCSGQIRVRHHGNLARIEVALENIAKLTHPGVVDAITVSLKKLGFHYVTLDLNGYRMGSTNEVLHDASRN